MTIKINDLKGKQIRELISRHLVDMRSGCPAESTHALGLDDLRGPEITVWSIWDGENLTGCGALKEIDKSHGEIKSMRTHDSYLRKGIASMMLEHIISEAKKSDYKRLSLETGANDQFMPARRLYACFGFLECGPFDQYKEDPLSVFMTMEL